MADLDKQVLDMLSMILKINKSDNQSQIFVDISPHVNWITLQIYPDGWESMKEYYLTGKEACFETVRIDLENWNARIYERTIETLKRLGG